MYFYFLKFIRIIRGFYVALPIFFKKKYSTLVVISDNANWVLDSLSKIQITSYFKKFFPNTIISSLIFKNQYLYLINQYTILKKNFFNNKNSIIALDYLHGLEKLNLLNKKLLRFVIKNQRKIKIIRVTNSFFKNYLVTNGIEKNKIFIIPLIFDKNYFCVKNNILYNFKKKYEIPDNKFIIGSFQKDGIGWKQGNSPKYIKGPDIFFKTVRLLNKKIPNLLVLLTGPARGYIINKLKKNNINFIYLDYLPEEEMPYAYSSLNLYLITSRDEGGPMAIFESMAVGTPVVSTLVGHAHDYIKNNFNGFVTKIDDVNQLVVFSYKIYKNKKNTSRISLNARLSVKKVYSEQKKLWKDFFNFFLDRN